MNMPLPSSIVPPAMGLLDSPRKEFLNTIVIDGWQIQKDETCTGWMDGFFFVSFLCEWPKTLEQIKSQPLSNILMMHLFSYKDFTATPIFLEVPISKECSDEHFLYFSSLLTSKRKRLCTTSGPRYSHHFYPSAQHSPPFVPSNPGGHYSQFAPDRPIQSTNSRHNLLAAALIRKRKT